MDTSIRYEKILKHARSNNLYWLMIFKFRDKF